MNREGTPKARGTLSATTLWWLVATGGLISAAWFSARALTKVLLLGGFGAVSRDVLWMSPLAHLILFGLAGVVVYGLTRVLPATMRLQAGVSLVAALALHAVLLPWTQLGIYSAVLLALGGGVALARRLVRSGEAELVVGLKRVSLSLAAAFVGALLLQGGWSVMQAPARSAPGEGPNVLFIVLDTFRANTMSAYGSRERLTPTLDSLAAEGTRFDWAISNAGWTLPAHATLFTGRYRQHLSVSFERRLDTRDRVLAEAFAGEGYETAGFVGNLHYTTWESGLARGFHYFEDYPRSLEMLAKNTLHGQTVMAEEVLRATTPSRLWRAVRRKRLMVQPKPEGPPVQAEEITNRFLRWHARRDGGRPYFAFLNYFDAHRPYLAPAPYPRSTADEDTTAAGYARDVQYMDRHIGRLLRDLQGRESLDSTIIMVVADHGEQFGEHGLYGHANSVYTPLVRVPLFVVWPGRIPSGSVGDVVSLRDVPATLADLAGLGAGTFPGVSLAGFWRDSVAHGSPAIAQHLPGSGRDPSVPASEQGMSAVFTADWQYVRTMRRALAEAFHYRTDPLDLENLAGTDSAHAGHAAAWDEYREALAADTAHTPIPDGRD